MKFARDGYPAIVGLFFMVFGASFISIYISIILLIPLAIVVWFFRDPERIPDSEDGFLSPADGKVVEIEEVQHEYTGNVIKIGIFMNAFDVHVNRFPVAGTVGFTQYVPGKKWFAIAPKASEENERFYVGAESKYGKFLLTQIAGILARRIVCRVKNGDFLDRGQRYGMIKLGSKVDIYLPNSIVPSVVIGEKVTAGKTVIGVLKKC
ncbi:MAG: phosphatidylserine decarboxylase family protein [Synergistaceae bacterium]|nr:phosphatidylserine decarboxylase family protein [Synergistaceae bacterium]